MKLSIVIINYKSEQYMERCLRSIHFKGDYEIIIVDNEGNEKLMQRIKRKYPSITIMPFLGNLGFALGNNKAIKAAKGEYILTLNADCFLTKDYIIRCVEFLEKNKGYSSVQGKLLLYQRKGYVDSTGNVLTTAGFAYSENHKAKDFNAESKEIFGVCAAAAVYRRSALDDVRIHGEYYDNDFFAYLEDVDLDWRLRLMGWKAYFLGTATAYHIREATSNHKFRFNQAIKNRFFMVIKNSSAFSMALNLIFYPAVLLFLPNRMKNIRLTLKMLKKRKTVQAKKKVSNKEIRKFMAKTPYLRYLRIIKLINLAR